MKVRYEVIAIRNPIGEGWLGLISGTHYDGTAITILSMEQPGVEKLYKTAGEAKFSMNTFLFALEYFRDSPGSDITPENLFRTIQERLIEHKPVLSLDQVDEVNRHLEGLTRVSKMPGDIGSLIADRLWDLADYLYSQGLYQEAKPYIQQCLAIRKKIPDSSDEVYRETLKRLNLVYEGIRNHWKNCGTIID